MILGIARVPTRFHGGSKNGRFLMFQRQKIPIYTDFLFFLSKMTNFTSKISIFYTKSGVNPK